MKHIESLNILIDKAAQIAGSDYRLAQVAGISRQQISDWRHGRKACPPADQALMAHVAGLDPVQVLARATVEAHEGKPKGDALMRALGKALPATGATVAFAGVVGLVTFSMAPTASYAQPVAMRLIQCILGLLQ